MIGRGFPRKQVYRACFVIRSNFVTGQLTANQRQLMQNILASSALFPPWTTRSLPIRQTLPA